MNRVAISGHRGLSPDVSALVERAIRSVVAEYGDLVGVSCLADGPDQIFARAVLDHGGRLEVVVPAAQYRDGLPDEAHASYDELIAKAETVHRLDHHESTADSHMDASVEMLSRADQLLAVWDGQPARGWGGTADVVAEARRRGLQVTVIWPDGATR